MNIDQTTAAAIINWQTFDIGLENSVIITQPADTSTLLSRILGGDISQILGNLQANGHFYLVNPAGVYFGQNATIDTGALIASTLDITDEDFMAGRNIFAGISEASIIIDGVILAHDFASLLAKIVTNNGAIQAAGGTVALGARETTFEFDSVYGSRITIDLSGFTAGDAINTGYINTTGLANNNGGAILIEAENIDNSGTVAARGAGGGHGGFIQFDSGDTGTTLITGAGTVDASGETGGEVRLLGDRVGLGDTASVDVSGETGGGTALIGGDFQGNNPEIRNASQTFVGSDVTITADAGSNGDGGTVIVWADGLTQFYGTISATGGLINGDGGFAEVSGKQALQFAGFADLTTTKGEAGTLLLDPANITINDAGIDDLEQSGDPITFQEDTAVATSQIDVDTINNALFLANVIITTELGSGTATAANSDITLNAPGKTISPPVANPDGDNLPNLVEYFIGLNPTTNDEAGAITLTISGNTILYTYQRALDAPDAVGAVEWSEDLSTWSTTGITEEVLSVSAETETVRATITINGGETAVFVRLNIDQPQP